ncbi:tRNA modification GTPase MnmE [Bacteroidia bacterium]|nr:tRNA modification GTPase MnmE [Bacteroidia bacterium]
MLFITFAATNLKPETLKPETIAAISTPVGVGATATIRVSGSAALGIVDSIFVSPRGKKLSQQKPNTIHFGKIVHRGQTLDEVLAAVFEAPHSYTGEDVAEIYCHGSVYIQQQILQALIDCGATMARAGEFTLRAFLNKKIDLVQAEAVGDLIAARTPVMHQMAMQQMRGGYSLKIKNLREQLLNFLSLLELELDFAEEDVEFANRFKFNDLATEILSVIDPLIQSFATGNAIKNGIPVVIAGAPNVGKSTLLNALLNDEKALVSPIPGTTRDAIEDTVTLGGTLFRFIDTAGLHAATDTVEQLGIERSYQKIEQASIILLVATSEPTLNSQFSTLNSQFSTLNSQLNKKYIVLLNKIDTLNEEEILVAVKSLQNVINQQVTVIPVSGKTRQGLETLQQTLVQLAALPQNADSDCIVSNARHYEAFVHAQQSLQRAQIAVNQQVSTELIAFEIREAIAHLSSIVGEITDADVLNNIFGKFCIGK